jgi:pimeloyl-ACP methyl ester carboxylesterase
MINRRSTLLLGLAVAGGAQARAAVPAGKTPPAATASPKTFTTVAGAGGVPLNVMETGDPNGPEILFVHGMSGSYLTWLPQLDAPALAHCRMVAFDMRGHGGSAKPWRPEDYAGSKLWADDIAAVIAAKGLKRPVIATWSFGGFVTMAYVRHYGLEHVGGINLAGNLGGLYAVDHSHPSATYQATMAASKLRSSRDLEENIEGYRLMAVGYAPEPLPPRVYEWAFLSGILQPSYVRRALKDLPLQNADLVPMLKVPMLLSAGDKDEEWPPAALKACAALLADATVSIYAGDGHYISGEHPDRFNTELNALVARAAKAGG